MSVEIAESTVVSDDDAEITVSDKATTRSGRI